jgi:hypothetical protein
MTHKKLLARINNLPEIIGLAEFKVRHDALRAVMELHIEDVGTPIDDPISVCDWCKVAYPCPTIQAILKELS